MTNPLMDRRALAQEPAFFTLIKDTKELWMPTRRSILLAAASLAVLPGSFSARAQSANPAADPKTLIDWIYVETGKSGKNPNYNFALMSKKQRGRFSKAFLAAWDRAEKIATRKQDALIEADPVTNSQDPQIHSFTTKVESQTDSKASVRATFRDSAAAKPQSVVYVLVKEDGLWKIDDIDGLRKQFAQYK